MELDEYGKRVWKHKTNKRLFLEQAYSWKPRMIMIEEFGSERNVVMSFDVSTFDYTCWESMTKEEFDSVKEQYKEIYDGQL